MSLTQDISTIKQHYRELFDLAHRRILELFETLQKEYSCPDCSTPPAAVENILHSECGYIEWQKASIFALENTIGKQILDSLEKIEAAKNVKGSCHSCGVCCSLASSEFNYDQLQEKASHGDSFASQFTSVFIPYESQEVAQQKFPDIVNDILTHAEAPVYFYHCPYLDTNNRCSIYNDPKRPDICASYPDTPLTFIYKNCGYQPWKTEMLPTTLLAHASLELCQHYANKILEAVKAAS